MADLEESVGGSNPGPEFTGFKHDTNPLYRIKGFGGLPRDKDKKDRNPVFDYLLGLYNSAKRLGTEFSNRYL